MASIIVLLRFSLLNLWYPFFRQFSSITRFSRRQVRAGRRLAVFSGLITAIELQGRALGYAIKYANFAASLSVTRSGNIASADYKSMLDLHFGTIL